MMQSAIATIDQKREEKTRISLDNSTTSVQLGCEKWNRCNRSNCIHCAKRRSYHRTANVVHNLEAKTSLFRLVLTLKALKNCICDTSLKERLTSLQAAFRTLRRSVFWKRHVKGGLYALHVDYVAPTKNWHVHYDLIIEAKPLNKSDIAKAWFAATGTSYIVHLRKIRETRTDYEKLSTYVLKPSFSKIKDNAVLMAEYKLAAVKKPKFRRFGNWQNTSKHQDNWQKPERASQGLPDAPEATIEPLTDIEANYIDECGRLLLTD
jgi:hypothetical protein